MGGMITTVRAALGRLNSPHAASQASAAALSSWNHTLDAAAPVLAADVDACYALTPYRC